MTNKIDGRYSFTAPVRMVFGNLFEAKPVGKKVNGKAPTGTPKFSATFALPADHPDLLPLKQKAVAVAQAQWPGRDLKELKFPWENGNKRIEQEKKAAEKENRKPRDNAFLADKLLVTARTKNRPALAYIEGGQIIDVNDATLTVAKSKLYQGMYVVAKLNFTAYEGQRDEDTGFGNPDGVNAYLDMVMKVKDGDRIGGGPSASVVFKDYIGTMTAEDPTVGAPDDLSDI
jgi:hypothetical protein